MTRASVITKNMCMTLSGRGQRYDDMNPKMYIEITVSLL